MTTSNASLAGIFEASAATVSTRLASRTPRSPKQATSPKSPGFTFRGTRIQANRGNGAAGTGYSRSYVIEQLLSTVGATRSFLEELDTGYSGTLSNFKSRGFPVVSLAGVYFFEGTSSTLSADYFEAARYALAPKAARNASSEPSRAFVKAAR